MSDTLFDMPPVATPTIPAGYVQVSSEAFFERLNRDPRDIMPSLVSRELTSWNDRNGNRFAVSSGWMHSPYTQGPAWYAMPEGTR